MFDFQSQIRFEEGFQSDSEIYKFAKKRFFLGYPPRKDKDNSIGDAVNWEWIIKCGIETGKNIIIVSRDGDFGSADTELGLNDWLKSEFQQRVGKSQEISLTNKLNDAFKQIGLKVTKQMEEEESRILNDTSELVRKLYLSGTPKKLNEMVAEIMAPELRQFAEKMEHMDYLNRSILRERGFDID